MVRVNVRHAGQRPPLVVRMAVVLLSVMAPVIFLVAFMAIMMPAVLDPRSRPDQLGGHQLGVQPVARQQFVVAPLFHGVTIIQHDYLVRVPDG